MLFQHSSIYYTYTLPLFMSDIYRLSVYIVISFERKLSLVKDLVPFLWLGLHLYRLYYAETGMRMTQIWRRHPIVWVLEESNSAMVFHFPSHTEPIGNQKTKIKINNTFLEDHLRCHARLFLFCLIESKFKEEEITTMTNVITSSSLITQLYIRIVNSL